MRGPNWRGRSLRLALAVTGAVAWICQGYDQALMNGLLTLPTFENAFPSISTATSALAAKNSTLQGTTVALYEVGAAFGAASCFYIGDRFGRKWTTFAAACIVLVGMILQTTSFQLAQLIVGRIITGLGVGSFTATIPTWVGESTEAHQRGSLVMLEGSAAIFGIMLVGWLELGFYFVRDSEVSWRFPIAFQSVFALLVIIAVPFLEESPRWLLSKNRLSEARRVISRLEDEPEDSLAVAARMKDIQSSLELDSQGHSSNPFVKTPNRHLHRTVLAVVLNAFSQMSGINLIIFYSTSILEHSLGYPPLLARIIAGCLQTWQFCTATSGVFLIDRFGRRKLLLLGAIGMCIANAGLAGLQSHHITAATAGGCLFFEFMALFCFPIGYFLVPFLYSAEIAPLRVRSQVTAMSGCANWLFNFLVAEITPKAIDSIGWRYYLVYVCTNATAAIFIYFFLPETKNRTLEDVDSFFVGSKGPFEPVSESKRLYARSGSDYEEKKSEEGRDERIEYVTKQEE